MTLTILGLLTVIIVDKVCCSEHLMNYISVCSILLSIILSIFAIQYTYFSNNEIHQQFDKINSAADIIKKTASNIEETNALLKNNLEHILERLDTIDSSNKEISQKIDYKNNQEINSSITNFQLSSKPQS